MVTKGTYQWVSSEIEVKTWLLWQESWWHKLLILVNFQYTTKKGNLVYEILNDRQSNISNEVRKPKACDQICKSSVFCLHNSTRINDVDGQTNVTKKCCFQIYNLEKAFRHLKNATNSAQSSFWKISWSVNYDIMMNLMFMIVSLSDHNAHYKYH